MLPPPPHKKAGQVKRTTMTTKISTTRGSTTRRPTTRPVMPTLQAETSMNPVRVLVTAMSKILLVVVMVAVVAAWRAAGMRATYRRPELRLRIAPLLWGMPLMVLGNNRRALPL